MKHVLVAVTRGDELMPSTEKVVAVGTLHEMEDLQERRLIERKAWESQNQEFPWWAKYALVREDRIDKVAEMTDL